MGVRENVPGGLKCSHICQDRKGEERHQKSGTFQSTKFADRNVCVLACKCQSVWGDMKAANKTTTISGNTELTHVTWV